jgi:hypothetical protein
VLGGAPKIVEAVLRGKRNTEFVGGGHRQVIVGRHDRRVANTADSYAANVVGRTGSTKP